ncbi:MAG: hypothetical protein LW816_14330 [Planctomyces sp.]|jgi:hypothetical protein|nr:hypothetical protein [Planctomyces sp.]
MTRALILIAINVTLFGCGLFWLREVRQDEWYLVAGEQSDNRRTADRTAGRARLDSGQAEHSDDEGRVRLGSAPAPVPAPSPSLRRQPELGSMAQRTPEQAAALSVGCISCHKDAHDPHYSSAVHLGCVDCHGGNPMAQTKDTAHVHARFPDVFRTSANPVRSYTVLNHEDPEFIRFVNPGDLRIAHLSCGTSGCHGTETLQVKKSMMTHGCMLWGAALYNNGAVSDKWSRYGESYSMHGTPQRLQTVPAPTPEETARKGVLPYLEPLPRFEITQPGNILRIFERGGRFVTDIGIPERLEESGRPRTRLSNRGLGTGTRTDPVFIGLQKTRLLDPTLNFLGTNDHPGDFRSSGCTACHIVYANDRSPVHSGPFAKYGNRGLAAAVQDDFTGPPDPTIPKNEPGHPIAHRFTTGVPTSQCIVCHMHPGTTVMNSYLGFMWWDMETDARFMYPKREREPSAEQFMQSTMSDPHEASARGNWSDPEFLTESSRLNSQLEYTQFADFHGHGWMFQAVFRKDRRGIPVDAFGNVVPEPDAALRQRAVQRAERAKELRQDIDWTGPDALERVRRADEELLRQHAGVPVHLLDIHLEKGMHCVDCHFVQDMHGNGKLYGEVRAAIEIRCEDCHGTAVSKAGIVIEGRRELRTGGPAAEERDGQTVGRSLSAMRTPFGRRRFEVINDRIVQNSMVEPGLSWPVTQVADTLDPEQPEYNAAAALAKTVRLDDSGQFKWGEVPADGRCGHNTSTMSCIACHTSWNPSCYGCHLPQKAARKTPALHNEGDITRNQVSYNFQTLREDVFMLAKDGNVTGNRIGPSRSSCAIHVTSYNLNREAVYTQQQTISADGLSGIAFSTNVPHTVRGKGETKSCTDCHLSDSGDNNAVLAQLLMHGTNYFNFIGRNCWVGAGDHGLFAVQVTERDEPQSVIGSTMHRAVYPQRWKEHHEHQNQLQHAHEHPGVDIGDQLLRPGKKPEILSLQVRGEYAYAACGEGGIRVFDIAFIEHKGFSERIVTAPVSPAGQKFHVPSRFATDIAAPTTIAPDPTRVQQPDNQEADIHPLYGYLYATDLHEGLIMTAAGTLLDGNPLNNFLKKDVVFNPNGLLNGASSITIIGTHAWICCRAGIVIVSLEDPQRPRAVRVLGPDQLQNPRAVEAQFRYAFVLDQRGLQVLDITQPENPQPAASMPLADARSLYVARSYAFVAAGKNGLVVVDVETPTEPRIDQVYTAGGEINDARDVKLGITYTSQFAYVADGHNGLRVIQLTSPETPGNAGFNVRPQPMLVASWPAPEGGEIVCVAEGVDRDRAIDEAGNQLAVFGRVGARPLNLAEQRKLYLQPSGLPWTVVDPQRDWTMRDSAERESQLRRQLRQFYGPDSRQSP